MVGSQQIYRSRQLGPESVRASCDQTGYQETLPRDNSADLYLEHVDQTIIQETQMASTSRRERHTQGPNWHE